jgi:hypothetical protein
MLFIKHNYEVVGKIVSRSIPVPAQVEKHGSGALACCPAHLDREQGQCHEILVGNIEKMGPNLGSLADRPTGIEGLFLETFLKIF